MTTKKTTAADLSTKLASQAPLGWTVTTGDGYVDAYGSLWGPEKDVLPGNAWARFEREQAGVAAVVALNVCVISNWTREKAFSGFAVEGHTLVNGGSFTRVGVDCSSCDLVDDPTKRYGDHAYSDLVSLLAGEWERCEQSVARSKTAEPIPGLPFSRQPEWFVKAAADIKAGKAVSLTPRGFGTGYTISRGPIDARRQHGFARATVALEAKLGVGPLYVSTFDHD